MDSPSDGMDMREISRPALSLGKKLWRSREGATVVSCSRPIGEKSQLLHVKLVETSTRLRSIVRPRAGHSWAHVRPLCFLPVYLIVKMGV